MHAKTWFGLCKNSEIPCLFSVSKVRRVWAAQRTEIVLHFFIADDGNSPVIRTKLHV